MVDPDGILILDPVEDGVHARVDAYLASRLPDWSRSRLQALLRAGRVRLGGAVIAEASARVKAGQVYSVVPPPVTPAAPVPEALPLDVLYEDDDLLVLEKPAGMVVHPAPGHARGTLVNALLHHCGDGLSGIGGVARPGIVHRLDRDVSGVMAVAKNDRAHRGLAGQFAVHSVERTYEGLTHGLPSPAEGTIDAAIGRHPRDRLRMAVVRAGGKPARTRYRVLAAAGVAAARVRLDLDTGRTHQIRVHTSHRGFALIGDPLYRPARRPAFGPEATALIAGLGRVALHARVLGFDHPATGERLRFERDPPEIFATILESVATERDL